jgi:hypothetical protein
MAKPDDRRFGDDVPEADVAEQLQSVGVRDDDTWRDAAGVTAARDWEATEADLIEQAIPVPDDDSEFER